MYNDKLIMVENGIFVGYVGGGGSGLCILFN